MKYLFDIGHPAHVHYFRNLIDLLKRRGHSVAVTAREKDVTLYLLRYYGLDFVCTGKNLSSKIGKLYSILRNDVEIYRVAQAFKPDLVVSFFSPFAAHVGKLLKKPVVAFNDTESAAISIFLAKGFTDHIVVPECYKGDLPDHKRINFKGWFELAYLHPNRFEPNRSVLDLMGVERHETYAICRFVSRSAGHDFGHCGISTDMKRKAVREFSKYGKVFISSEIKLPNDLARYQMSIRPEMMHSALFFATLLYGESATMASESAVLGTPAIFLDDRGRGYTREAEDVFGLIYNFSESAPDQERSIWKGVELLNTPSIKEEWRNKRAKMLAESIDVTAFMTWLVENYPESAKIMKKNPHYYWKFQ